MHPCDKSPDQCICKRAYGKLGTVFDIGDGHWRDCWGPTDASDDAREKAMWNLEDIVREYSARIKNGRTIRTAFDHMKTEVTELNLEITALEVGAASGDDGIVGEGIDIIACVLDIIFLAKPNISNKELAAIMERKCRKWAENY